MQYDNTNTGILFINDQKGNPKAPVYKGKINVAGKEFDLAGWVKEGQKGKFLSLSVSEPYNKAEGDKKVNELRAEVVQSDNLNSKDDSSLPF